MRSSRLAYSIVAGILSIGVVSDVLAQSELPQDIIPTRATVSQLADMFDKLPRNSIPLGSREAFEASQKPDIVIFIPGILGSRLTDSTGVIWPTPNPLALGNLPLREGSSRANADLLLDYYQDIYGRMRDELLQSVLPNRDDLLEFPYDWRHDIDTIATWLDQDIKGKWRSTLRHRHVTIIAHSMGSLVAWSWKNRFYGPSRREYEFTLSNLVVLGAPLHGSCEILRMLLLGYKPATGAGAVERSGYAVLFGPLKAAAYTFPSVFELLVPSPASPADNDLRTSCLVVDSGVSGAATAVDHFNPAVWDKTLFPALEPGFLSRWFGTKPVWDQLGMSRASFLTLFTRLLETGKRFRKEFRQQEEPIGGPDSAQSRLHYFYSERRDTVYQVQVSRGQIVGKALPQGDGRVPVTSALNEGYRSSSASLTSLSEGHGELIKDPNFLSWLKYKLSDAVKARRVQGGIEALWSDPMGRAVLTQEIRERGGGVVALSDLGFDPFAPDAEPARKAVIDLNTALLTEQVKTSVAVSMANLPNIAYAAGETVRAKGNHPTASVPLFELAFATGITGEQRAAALASYSQVLVNQKAYKLAIATIEPRQVELKNASVFKAVTLNNLGVAYECEDRLAEARAAYQFAAAAGLRQAKDNLFSVGFKREACGKDVLF